ncbi:MAG: PspC family transcriptional regulator [Saprospiraceae bacterium]|nr:PspC family transcriptional regulator [Saprospiraceae bacterium]
MTERTAFGVCSYIGDKIGLASSRIRIYFIYLSFITMGSPLVIYLIIAFWLNLKNYLQRSRSILNS